MRKRSTGLLPFRRRVGANGLSPLTAPAWRGSRLALPRAAKTAGSVAPQGVCSSRAHSRAPPRFVKPKPPKGGGHFSRKSHSLRQSLQKAPGNRGFFASTALAARPLTLPPAKVDSARSAAEPSLAPRILSRGSCRLGQQQAQRNLLPAATEAAPNLLLYELAV